MNRDEYAANFTIKNFLTSTPDLWYNTRQQLCQNRGPVERKTESRILIESDRLDFFTDSDLVCFYNYLCRNHLAEREHERAGGIRQI